MPGPAAGYAGPRLNTDDDPEPVILAMIEHSFYGKDHALGQPETRRASGNRGRRPAPADRTRRGRPDLRYARLPRHDLLRGTGQVGGEPGTGGVPDAVPVDRQPLPGLPACVRLLPVRRDASPD